MFGSRDFEGNKTFIPVHAELKKVERGIPKVHILACMGIADGADALQSPSESVGPVTEGAPSRVGVKFVTMLQGPRA